MTLSLTPHARRRCAQRAIPLHALELALLFGLVVRQANGFDVYFLGRRQWQQARQVETIPEKYRGVAVVLAPNSMVITAIRCQSLDRIKRCAK